MLQDYQCTWCARAFSAFFSQRVSWLSLILGGLRHLYTCTRHAHDTCLVNKVRIAMGQCSPLAVVAVTGLIVFGTTTSLFGKISTYHVYDLWLLACTPPVA